MASEEEKIQQGDGKGFAGLSSMVSDVDATVASNPKQTQREATTSSTQQSSQAGRTVPQEQPKPNQQTYQSPAQPSSGSSAGKWLFGIAAVIGVIWLANQSDNNSSSRPAYSPGRSSTPVTPAPAWQPPAAQPQAPNRPAEEKPSIGRNNVLSTAQIRYCLAEKIRLDAAETVINNYVESDVDRFNGYIDDYNSRCGEFRYRQGSLESARRDVESYRSQLQAEGHSRFVRSSSTATRSQAPAQTPQPVLPSPDATLQAIQLRLNELGYDAGPADGLMGNGTRTAIIAFQRDKQIAVTGAGDQSLFLQLQRAVPIANSSSDTTKSLTATSPTSRNIPAPFSPGSTRPSVPANAWASGSSWYCNDEYRKVGDKCEALNVPANAWVSGSNWYCNDGYRKVGDRCERLNVPPNAWVSGSNWYCNNGYRKVGDKCEALNIPANAWVSGSNWYCNDGYRKVGDKCVSVFNQQ